MHERLAQLGSLRRDTIAAFRALDALDGVEIPEWLTIADVTDPPMPPVNQSLLTAYYAWARDVINSMLFVYMAG